MRRWTIALLCLLPAGWLAPHARAQTIPLQIVTPGLLPNATAGVYYETILEATGGCGPYGWQSISGTVPPGLGLAGATGLISGTPTQPGSFSFRAQVTDCQSVKATKDFQINVAPPLAITTTSPLRSGTVGRSYLQTFEATGGQPPYRWGVSAGLPPPGLTVSQDGKFQGIPAAPGPYSFQVSVFDSAQGSAHRQYTILIDPALQITSSSPLPGGAVGAAYSFQLSAIGGAQPYAWTVASGALPPGLSLAGNGRITGVPTHVGDFVFEVMIADQVLSTARATFSLAITSSLAITTASPLPDGAIGASYSETLAATGGTAPYTWSLVSGSLPPGLAISSAGTILGAPAQAGTFVFTVRVADLHQVTAVKEFSITVMTFAIVTQSPLPDGVAGSQYSQSLEAAGGAAPYAWRIVEGALPPGLSLGAGGVISGVPGQAGAFMIQVRVTDQNQRVLSKVFTLTIRPQPLGIATASLPAATSGRNYFHSMQAGGGSPPYGWTAAGLPPGLAISAEGNLVGTTFTPGSYPIRFRVEDTAGGSAAATLTLVVNPGPVSGVQISGLEPQLQPAQQVPFTVSLTSAYPQAVSGRITLEFTSEAAVPSDDPAIQFSSGGRSADFTVPAGATGAVFPSGSIAIQTGSVAGRIALRITLQSGGQDVTPSPAPAWEVQVARTPPRLTSVRLARVSGGFEVIVAGISPAREVTQAEFRFTAAAGVNLQTTQVTVQLGQPFAAWYQSEASRVFGSAFQYRQPFTITGDQNAVASVSVTLSNTQGASSPSSAGF